MSKDYYKILGLEKKASPDEIKKAFRKLAHTYHPDKQGGDEAKFKEVNEAYQILGDEKKRQQYDQFGADFEQQGGFGGGQGWDDFMKYARGGFNQGNVHFDFGGNGFGDIFGDIFGFGGTRGGGRGQRRGSDIQVDVSLSFREAAFGVERELSFMKQNDCAVCGGSGAEPGTQIEICKECGGQGQVRRIQQTILGAMQTAGVCPSCGGEGQRPTKRCKHCGGDGTTRSESKFTVKIPAGIHEGGVIRLSGKGESAGARGTHGDLYVRVHIAPEQGFEREGFDVHTTAHISFPQAALGDKIDIETLDGVKKLVIPEGTQSHQQFRLKGFGIQRLNASGRGDQYVTVIVDVPKKVGRKGKKLLDELAGEV